MSGWTIIPTEYSETDGVVVFGSRDHKPPVELASNASASVSQSGSQAAKRLGVRGTLLLREALERTPGQSWSVYVSANAQERSLLDYSYAFEKQQVLELNDLYVDVPGGTLTDIEVGIRLEGLNPQDAYYLLPYVALSSVDIDDSVVGIVAENRFPYPNQVRAPKPSRILRWVFDYANYDADVLPTQDITIAVNGVVVYTGMADVFGTTTISAVDSRRRHVEIDVSGIGPWNAPVNNVQSISVTGTGVDLSWSWDEENGTAPTVVNATFIGQRQLQVEFSEDMSDGFDVDNIGAYDVYPESPNAFAPEVVALQWTSERTVVLELNQEVTFRKNYTLTVSTSVTDASGFPLLEGSNTYVVRGLEFIQERRVLDVLRCFSEYNVNNDSYSNLEKTCFLYEDLLGQAFHRVDSLSAVLDPQYAPIEIVEGRLKDLGNDSMFTFDLTELEKRQLLTDLSRYQELVGTREGIESALQFFLGLDLRIRTTSETPVWILGVSFLGVDTFLAPEELSDAWFTIWVVVPDGFDPETLTKEQLDRIAIIVNVMGPAESRYGGVVTNG